MNTSLHTFRRTPYATLLNARYKPRTLALTQDSQTLGRELCVALFRNENALVQELISFGAPLDYRDDPDGWTPLIYSIYYDNPKGRALLLRAGADPKVTDYAGRTTLMFAAITGDPQLIGELNGAGVAVDAVDHRGKSALDFAEEYRNTECIALLNRLLGRGAWSTPPFIPETLNQP